MPDHQTPLIATIAAGLMLAFLFGLVAHRLKVQPLVGYLLAGVAVGPFTPGIAADPEMAQELAEIGVILLMFGVGLHFSLKDLMSVAKIAVPGALGQIAAATLLGGGLAHLLGWDIAAGLVFGLALSVASTVVMVRALQDRHLLDSERGRIAVGWLVVEDLVMVLALILVPAAAMVAKGDGVPLSRMVFYLLITLLKVSVFVAVMLLLGRRVIPWLMHRTASTGSRELFRLAVYAIALGVAFGAAKMFGVSFALGAFFAGMVMGETDLSQDATQEAIPLRDAFAVLFFVSVGMLLDPTVFVEAPLAVALTVATILIGKSAVAWLIVRLFGRSNATALTVAGSLAQVGEFSYILIGLGVSLQLVPAEARDLIVAGSIVSIALNPLTFALLARLREPEEKDDRARGDGLARRAGPPRPTGLSDHDVLVGYGRVGSVIGADLAGAGRRLLVIDTSERNRRQARADGAETLAGNAAAPEVLAAANVAGARRVLVTIPDAFEAGQVVQRARAANPAVEILARAHSDAAVEHLAKLGADLVVSGEREIAHRMLDQVRDPAPAALHSA